MSASGHVQQASSLLAWVGCMMIADSHCMVMVEASSLFDCYSWASVLDMSVWQVVDCNNQMIVAFHNSVVVPLVAHSLAFVEDHSSVWGP